MPGGGTITVRSFNCTAATPHPRDARPGDYVCIGIADAGAGMRPEVLARVFEPFFTTKDVGKGTGLGLSTAHSAVRQMGGDLSIDSAPGQGTVVHIFLRVGAVRPVAARTPAASPATTTALVAEPILYVEDNALVSLSTVDALEHAGLAVHAVHDAHQALQTLDQRPEIQIMVTDVDLPGMDGHELAREARRRRPELRILFLSGYDRSRLSGGLLDERNTLYLAKPYDESDLLESIRKLQGSAVQTA
jgi:CheY-like chemotaxis protein